MFIISVYHFSAIHAVDVIVQLSSYTSIERRYLHLNKLRTALNTDRYHTIGAKQLRTATPFLMSQQVDGTSLLMVKLKLIGMLQITLLKSVTVYNFFCVDAHYQTVFLFKSWEALWPWMFMPQL